MEQESGLPPESVTIPVDPVTVLTAQELAKMFLRTGEPMWPWPILNGLDLGPPDFLVADLIQPGDQALLSSPPKSGKSFLALELALKIASGSGYFLRKEWSIQRPRKVLYVSFEMPPPAMAARLKPHQNFCATSSSTHGSYLSFLFVSDEAFVGEDDLIHYEDEIRDAIAKAMPEFIIFDTLIQMHHQEENDNVAMSRVMKKIRSICKLTKPDESTKRIEGSRIAHLLLHHNRKVPAGGKGGGGAESVRGAGSIHSEVDLALSLASANSRYNNRFELIVSARNTSQPGPTYWTVAAEPSFHLEQVDRNGDPLDAEVPGKVPADSAVSIQVASPPKGEVAERNKILEETVLGFFESCRGAYVRRKHVWEHLATRFPTLTEKQFSGVWSRLDTRGIIASNNKPTQAARFWLSVHPRPKS